MTPEWIGEVGTIAASGAACAAILYPAIRALIKHRQEWLNTSIAKALDVVQRTMREEFADGINDLVEETGRRFDANDRATEKAAELAGAATERLTRIEAQFGPNGGGLREKVDKIGTDVACVVTAQEVAKARLEDHIAQTRDDRARIGALEKRALNPPSKEDT